jgi:fused signal recognition particle receptor
MGLFDVFRRKKTQETTDDLAQQAPLTDAQPIIKHDEAPQSAPTLDEQSEQESVDTPDTPTEVQVSQPVEAPHSVAQEVVTPDVTTQPTLTDDQAVEAQPVSETQAYEEGLQKTRESFSARFNRFLSNFRTVDEDFFEELEETLIGADVGFQNTLAISDALRDEVRLRNAKRPEQLREVIVQKMVELYEAEGQNEDNSMHFAKEGPTVILFVGVNGVGKTTTIGKLATKYQQEGKKVLLAAADTFRAGATQQLQEWGQRASVPVVAGKEKADPASVVFEAVKQARDTQADILFVDTAGRLQNNVNLMQELEKMKRIIEREIPGAPHEVLLVLDATTGQNALQQAKLFKDSSDVSGIVLTKLDGTAKGGIVLAIRGEMHLPVKWVGLGEKATDLRAFNSEEFAYSLFKDLI